MFADSRCMSRLCCMTREKWQQKDRYLCNTETQDRVRTITTNKASHWQGTNSTLNTIKLKPAGRSLPAKNIVLKESEGVSLLF